MKQVIVDVREDLKQGKEPFHKIMAAVDALGDDEQLVLFSTFEPRPLLKVMESKGFTHESEEQQDGDWRVTFTRVQSTE